MNSGSRNLRLAPQWWTAQSCFVGACAALGLIACSPAPSANHAAHEPTVPPQVGPRTALAPEAPQLEEPLAVHMRDHLNLLTQARDALIRGRLVDATGALTWLAHHREPKASALARPFLDRLHQHAQRALDSSDLGTAADAVGALAATCGECHAARGNGPKLEPSGLEDLDNELTVATHMHGYLWASETLWNALVADSRVWTTGVTTLAALKPPARPRELAPGFASVRDWAKTATSLASPSERGAAYGRLITTCATCHVAHGVDLRRTR